MTSNEYEKSNEYLSYYLNNIRSSGKIDAENPHIRYKRVCISPLRYAGGKSKAIGIILSNLPKLVDKKVISPFFGGGSFELCISQELDIQVVAYDIFGLLVNFWKVLIEDKDNFIKELKKFHINKEEFTYNRHLLLNYWDKIKPKDLSYKTMKQIELKETDKNSFG